MRVVISFIVSLVVAIFTKDFFSTWLMEKYPQFYNDGPFFLIPSDSPNIDGYLFSYIFFSTLIVSIVSNDYKKALYFALPIVVLMGASKSPDPHLWLSLLLLALGLGLAWLILKLKAYFFPKATPPGNLE